MGRVTREGRSRGQPRGMPKRGSGDRGGARGSWRLQASKLGALHRHAKASGRGTRGEARRSDSSRSTSFDEAAVQAGLVLLRREHDRERQRLASDRPDGQTGHGEGALLGRLSIKSLQVRAERVPRETGGHRGPDQSWKTAVKRGSTRGHIVRTGLGSGGWSWKPASNAKANEEGDSGVERFIRVLGSCRWLQKSERGIFLARAERTAR